MINSTKMKLLAVSLAVILTACGGAAERKASYLEKGKEYFSEKNYEKAKIEFKNVLQIDPKFADAYYYMGQLDEASNDMLKAAGNYQKAIQLDPDHFDAKSKLARIYILVGTDEYTNQGKALLQEVFAKKPDHLNALLVESIIDFRSGKKEDAVIKLKKIIERDPSLIEAYTLLSSMYVANGKDDDAISLLKSGIAKNNKDISLKATLVQLLLKGNRDFSGAEALVINIIELDPSSYNYRIALASLYASNDKKDKAELVLRKAITDKKDDAQRYLQLVQFLAKNKSAKLAETELLLAIKNNPDLYDLKFALAEFYLQLKTPDKAIATLTALSGERDLAPEGLKAKSKLADIFVSRGDIKQAQELIDVVLKEAPNTTDALFIKGKLAFMGLDDQTAINSLRSVLKDEPRNNEAAFLLSQAHERNNESELAKETLVHILKVDPMNPKNHLNYANYLASKNEVVKAEEVLDRALTFFKSDYDLIQGKLKFSVFNKDEKSIIKILDLLKATFPDKEEVRMQRGQYFVASKKYPQALEEFEAALQHSTTVFAPLEAIVKTHMSMGQGKKAIEMLQARLAAHADDVLASNFLGQVYASQNEKTKALEYFGKAMNQNIWDAPYLGAASVHLANKDVKSALSVLESGASKIPNPAAIQLQMASIYEYQKEYEKAIFTYEEILKTNPTNQMAANNLASLLLDYRSDDKNVKRALELVNGFSKSKHPALMDTMGWAYLKNNDATKAVSVFEEVIRLSPDIGVFQYHLGMAYHQAGDMANAKRYLTMAVANKQNYTGKDKAKDTLAKL